MAREHRVLLVVLVFAGVLRVATASAYAPALLYADSWGYLSMAFSHATVGVAPMRPSGYPLAMRIVSPVGVELWHVTLAQHFAGIGTALLTYATALRLRAPRPAALVVAAVVGLDAYAVMLEQYVLAEALFTLAVTLALFLTTAGEPRASRLAPAGLLIAFATLMRPVGLFAVPVWLAGIAVARPGRRAWAAGAAAVLVPILAYASVHAAVTGTFGLTQSTGWFLYGRIAPLVECGPGDVSPAQRPLCRATLRRRTERGSFFIWSRRSPAHRLYGPFSSDPRKQRAGDAALLRFSLRIVSDRPDAYAAATLTDTARFFTPAASTASSRLDDSILVAPTHPALRWDDPALRRRLLPRYRVRRSSLADALHAYGRAVHTARWLLALCALATIGGIFLSPREHAWRLGLLIACPMAMLVGAAATAGFGVRYLVPVAPAILSAGAASLAPLGRAISAGGRGHIRVSD